MKVICKLKIEYKETANVFNKGQWVQKVYGWGVLRIEDYLKYESRQRLEIYAQYDDTDYEIFYFMNSDSKGFIFNISNFFTINFYMMKRRQKRAPFTSRFFCLECEFCCFHHYILLNIAATNLLCTALYFINSFKLLANLIRSKQMFAIWFSW